METEKQSILETITLKLRTSHVQRKRFLELNIYIF